MFPASAGINRTCYHFLSCRTYVPRVSGDNHSGMFRPGSFPPGLPHLRIRPALDRIHIPQFPMHHFIRFFQYYIIMFGQVFENAFIHRVVAFGIALNRYKDIFIPIESNAKRYDAMNKGIFKDLTKHNDVILKKSYEVMHGELGNVDSIQSWSNA